MGGGGALGGQACGACKGQPPSAGALVQMGAQPGVWPDTWMEGSGRRCQKRKRHGAAGRNTCPGEGGLGWGQDRQSPWLTVVQEEDTGLHSILDGLDTKFRVSEVKTPQRPHPLLSPPQA